MVSGHGLSLAGTATSIIFVATKVLSRQIFVATNITLLRQKFYRYKHTFVATKHVFCRDKSMHVNLFTKRLSRQKTCFFVTNTCLSRDKTFVATNMILDLNKILFKTK